MMSDDDDDDDAVCRRLGRSRHVTINQKYPSSTGSGTFL